MNNFAFNGFMALHSSGGPFPLPTICIIDMTLNTRPADAPRSTPSLRTLTPPLRGIKVADFSQGVAGPHAALFLANQGADVVKVEPPEGDWGRVLGRSQGDYSAYSLYYNRGKRSIALDLKSPRGRELAFQIASQADVVIESFRPGVMKRLGLDYERLSNANAKQVYLSVTGFGQQGPYEGLPATDAVIQAFSGLMNLNRSKDGVPQRVPMVLVDVVSGIYGAQAVLAALLRQIRFGEGQYIDCNLLQCATALQASCILENHLEGGKPRLMYVPLGVFPTSNGFLTIAVMHDHHFVALCGLLGAPELAVDPMFATRDARLVNEHLINRILCEHLAKGTSQHWAECLAREGILHAHVRTYEQMLEDPHTVASDHLSWLTQPGLEGTLPVANVPGAVKADEIGRLASCPAVGEHTKEILFELGLDASAVDECMRKGVAFTGKRPAAANTADT